MFKQLFQAMNEQLEYIIQKLPSSAGAEKQSLLGELGQLRSISDSIIEEWLRFEEKMAAIRLGSLSESDEDGIPMAAAQAEDDECQDEPLFTMPYQRGEGYFKLFMFQEAAKEFAAVVASEPEHLRARLYLSICFIQIGDLSEAQRHLHILLQLADHKTLKAVVYNALGCIQAILGNQKKAAEYFQCSLEFEPNFQDALYNLNACQTDGGVLQLGVALG